MVSAVPGSLFLNPFLSADFMFSSIDFSALSNSGPALFIKTVAPSTVKSFTNSSYDSCSSTDSNKSKTEKIMVSLRSPRRFSSPTKFISINKLLQFNLLPNRRCLNFKSTSISLLLNTSFAS